MRLSQLAIVLVGLSILSGCGSTPPVPRTHEADWLEIAAYRRVIANGSDAYWTTDLDDLYPFGVEFHNTGLDGSKGTMFLRWAKYDHDTKDLWLCVKRETLGPTMNIRVLDWEYEGDPTGNYIVELTGKISREFTFDFKLEDWGGSIVVHWIGHEPGYWVNVRP